MDIYSGKKLGLSLHWDEGVRQAQYAFAMEHGLAIEIVNFAWAALWNDQSQRKQCVSLFKRELKDIPLKRSLHGPFQDITPHAQDRDIRRIVGARVGETIEIGMELGIHRFVFHTGINPVVTDPRYYEDVVNRQVEFWSDAVRKFPDAMICLENMWEPSALLQRHIIDRIASPHVKACLDTGHVNVYSHVPLREWFGHLSSDLIHFHLNDNRGDVDTHLNLGAGSVPWSEFFTLSRNSPEDVVFILELDSFEKMDTLRNQKASLEFITNQSDRWLPSIQPAHDTHK